MFNRKFLTYLPLITVLLLLLFYSPFITSVMGATINDLSPASSQYKAVNFLVDRKIMEVDQNNNFKPSLLVSKLDLAKYLYNLIVYYKLENLSTSSVEGELSKLQSRVSSLEKQVQTSSSAQSSIQNDISDIKKRLTSLESKVGAITTQTPQISQSSQTKDVSKDLEQLSKRISALEQADIQMNSKISSLNSELSKISSISTELAKIPNLSNEINKIPTLNSDLNALKTEVKSNTQRIESKIAALENSINSSQQDIGKISTLSTQISKLEGRISALEESQRKDLSNVENMVIQNSKEIEKLKTLNNLYTSASKEIDSLMQRVSKIEEVINRGDDFIEKLDAIDVLTVVDFVGNFQILSNRFDQLVAKYTKIEEQMRSFSVEQQYIIDEISNVKSSIEKTSDLSVKVSELSSSQEKTDLEVENLNKEVESLRSELQFTRWLAIAGTVTSVVLGLIFIVTAGQ
ncbi:MAG TPA: S-layer homology domain-containing protein [Fervidobacterium sp.]|nr:S-layer homology domain-containing protein [Fervidobacterium sp.]HOM73691.1 S-layer homology domain-containing protein [Fervidobacterium sp.]HRD20163.1 S-layer homology domain-containing protein [Fervidobacterium sp.]